MEASLSALMPYSLLSTPNHIPHKYKCGDYCYVGIRHVYLTDSTLNYSFRSRETDTLQSSNRPMSIRGSSSFGIKLNIVNWIVQN